MSSAAGVAAGALGAASTACTSTTAQRGNPNSTRGNRILLRKDAINVMPVNNVYGAVVLGMDASNVDTVFIGGTLRKSNGRLVGVDLGRIGRLAQESRDFIVAKAGWPRTLMGGYLPGH